MKTTFVGKLIPVLLVLLPMACSGPKEPAISTARIQGVSGVFNLSKSGTWFGSNSLSDQLSGMALEDGDLLYVLCGDEPSDIFFRYHAKQGESLTFKADSLSPFRVCLNEGLFSLNLSDSAAWEWLAKGIASGMDSLHSIGLKLPIAEREMGILQQLAKTKPDVNLMLEAKDQVVQCEQVLTLFKPDWLYLTIDTNWTLSETILENLSQLSLLGLSVGQEAQPVVQKLYQLPNLQQLILSWDPGKGPLIDFKNFKKLSSLSLSESNITSLYQLSLPETIHSLFFVECDSLSDIAALATLKNLKVFGLSGCNMLTEPGPLGEIKDLSWLSLPCPVKQSQFDALLPRMNFLQVLEMSCCDSIRDLTALNGLTHLKALSLPSGAIHPGSMQMLGRLKLLVLKPDTGVSGENQLKELRSQLPSTLVVPGKGFCLGSGWLLLLLPLVFTSLVLINLVRLRKRRSEI